jgi:hypothetical protein
MYSFTWLVLEIILLVYDKYLKYSYNYLQLIGLVILFQKNIIILLILNWYKINYYFYNS